MRRLLLIFLLLGAVLGFVACNDEAETTWDKYRDWREANQTWLLEQQARTNPDGTPYYQVLVPEWYPGAFVLMHHFNDPAEYADKVQPIYTSTVDVRYRLHLYDGTPVDSSDNITAYGAPGIFRTALNRVVTGWAIALTNCHCGDTVEVIVPYAAGYGESTQGIIPPYSNMRFNIRLVDVPDLDKPPYQ